MGLISGDSRYRDPDEIACMNELIDLMPSLEEANSMSILMDKKMKYKPIILNPVVIGEPKSKVRVSDLIFYFIKSTSGVQVNGQVSSLIKYNHTFVFVI